MTRRMVIVSDLHVGSKVGLSDPSEDASDDAGLPVRERLFEAWRTAVGHARWSSPDILVVNGDTVEGKNRKKGGVGLWTTELDRQRDHAVHLLRMWNAKQTFMTTGSDYHVQAGGSGLDIENDVAKASGAEPCTYDSQLFAPPEWYLTVEGLTFHIQHFIPVSRVFHYVSTPIAREMMQAKLNDALRHEVTGFRTSITIRSHAHYTAHIEYSSTHGFITPCWKGKDDFMMRKGSLGLSPDIGFLGFEINSEGFTFEKVLWRQTEVQRPNHIVITGSGNRARHRPTRTRTRKARK